MRAYRCHPKKPPHLAPFSWRSLPAQPKPSSSKASVARAESAKRKARDEEVSSGDSGTPSFMEELMGTMGGEIVVPEVRLFRSRYDLSDEYRPCFLVPAVGLRWRKH